MAAVCLESEKTAASPKVPTACPSTSLPMAWAASSMSAMPDRSHLARSPGAGSGLPYRLVVSTAESPDQVSSGTAARSIEPSSGFSGACTGRSPAASTTKKMTSSLTGDIRTRPPGAHQWRSATYSASRQDGRYRHSRPSRSRMVASSVEHDVVSYGMSPPRPPVAPRSM
ncbi:hypothetical protein A8W25_11655 [Streptomyces sp. ERV7]|nr:hypothetical protein A8W25_11655 [Streptomyces sp. ERV7]